MKAAVTSLLLLAHLALPREAGFEIRRQRNRSTEPGEENYPVWWYQILAMS